MRTLLFKHTSAKLGESHAQSSALRVQQLSQVKVQKHHYQNHKDHSPLKHIRVQLVILDLLVSAGITQALRLVEHDLIDLFVDFIVVSVIAPHGDSPHQQPESSSEHRHNHVQDVIRFLLLGGEYKQFFVHVLPLLGLRLVWCAQWLIG